MAEIYLICEGDDNSLDFKILNRIVLGKLNKTAQIYPAGGDGGLGSVARWLEKIRGGRAYSIEDRNYRFQDEVEQSWSDNGKSFIWRRHEIENYLFDPAIVTQTMISFRQTAGASTSRLPQTQAEVETVLLSLAAPLFDDHVGQLACTRLVKDLNSLELQFHKQRKKLLDRKSWLELFRQECRRLKARGSELAQLPAFADESLADGYDQLHAELSQSGFLSGSRCLKEMDGKKLMARLLDFVKARGFPRLSQSDLESELIQSLEQQYFPGYFASGTEPDDFVELADRLI